MVLLISFKPWIANLCGISRSPDGLCLLTNSDDNQLRVFEIPCDRLPSNEDLVKIPYLLFSLFDQVFRLLFSISKNPNWSTISNGIHTWIPLKVTLVCKTWPSLALSNHILSLLYSVSSAAVVIIPFIYLMLTLVKSVLRTKLWIT